jgi:hypothetical protein
LELVLFEQRELLEQREPLELVLLYQRGLLELELLEKTGAIGLELLELLELELLKQRAVLEPEPMEPKLFELRRCGGGADAASAAGHTCYVHRIIQ